MTVTLTFPQPAPRLSMNDRQHWAARSRNVRAWREMANLACFGAAELDGVGATPMFVRVTFPVRDNRRRDADNPAPTVKAIVDGLVDAGVWPDDTPEWVETLGSRFAKGADVVVVELIPREVTP
jgi:crossover junction endodeoxyribonuclease RusA